MPQESSDAKRIEPPRKVDFMLKPRFTNTVPDVPFDAKFMTCPFVPLGRFVEFQPAAIYRDYKHAVICDDDMGLNVDLIDLKKYDEDPIETEIDEKDNILLEDDGAAKLIAKRSQQHSKLVPWMRKTEYISTEFNRFGVTADRQETKLGYNLKKNQQVEDMYRDKQSQIDAINKTFEDVRKPVKEHYSKKGVKAVEESFVFPDFDHWKHLFAHVQFDGDTITTEFEEEDERQQARESSVIKAMEFEDQKFAAVFVPTIGCLTSFMDDLELERPFDEDMKYEFLLSREYTFKMEHLPPRDRDVFIMYHRNNVFQYNEVDCNVKMTRKPKMALSRKSKLTLTYRNPSELEQKDMNKREAELYEQPKTRKQEILEKIQEKKEEGGDSSDQSSDSDDDKPQKSRSDSSSDVSSDDDSPRKKEPTVDSDSD